MISSNKNILYLYLIVLGPSCWKKFTDLSTQNNISLCTFKLAHASSTKPLDSMMV